MRKTLFSSGLICILLTTATEAWACMESTAPLIDFDSPDAVIKLVMIGGTLLFAAGLYLSVRVIRSLRKRQLLGRGAALTGRLPPVGRWTAVSASCGIAVLCLALMWSGESIETVVQKAVPSCGG